MNIERKMNFIVGQMAALTVSQQATDARLDRLAAGQEKTDRQIRGLQTLVKAGMQMIVRLEHGQRDLAQKIDSLVDVQIRTDQRMAELAAAQKRTDERFDRWLNSLNRGANGHKKKPN